MADLFSLADWSQEWYSKQSEEAQACYYYMEKWSLIADQYNKNAMPMKQLDLDGQLCEWSIDNKMKLRSTACIILVWFKITQANQTPPYKMVPPLSNYQ